MMRRRRRFWGGFGIRVGWCEVVRIFLLCFGLEWMGLVLNVGVRKYRNMRSEGEVLWEVFDILIDWQVGGTISRGCSTSHMYH